MAGRPHSSARQRTAVALVISALLVSAHFAAKAVEPQNVDHVGVLAVDEGLWWDGGPTKDRIHLWEACEVDQPCWHYDFDVAAGGTRLRVAIDYLDRESRYVMRLRKPDGESLPLQWDPRGDSADLATSNDRTGPTTLELVIKNPASGTYRLSVDGIEIAEDTFRARAVLDGVHTPDPKSIGAERLPNVRPIPPLNPTFDASLAGRAPERPPSHGQLGIENSCNEDERQISGARVCLRFAAGGMNLGDGPLDITFSAVDANLATNSEQAAPATQVIHLVGGGTRTRDAGTVYLHAPHGHVHYEGALVYELYRVVDGHNGVLTRVGAGHKTGYCMTDYFLSEWFSLDVETQWGGTASNCGTIQNLVAGSALYGPPEEWAGTIGWSKGWGDLYPNWKEGQYVEFADADPSGQYVIRSLFDPYDRILETNEDDNSSYLLIDVQGSSVTAVERGFGDSPWDPNKEIVTGWMFR